MRSTRSRSLSVLAAGLASVLLLACSAGGGSISSSAGESGSENIGAADGVFFVLDRADLTAHAALIELGDLPGVGWTVTSRDDPGSDDGAAYDLLAEAEPSCAQLVRMSGQAGGILNIGGGINGEPVAWSQIVFERVSADQTSTRNVFKPRSRLASRSARPWPRFKANGRRSRSCSRPTAPRTMSGQWR